MIAHMIPFCSMLWEAICERDRISLCCSIPFVLFNITADFARCHGR